MLEGSLQIMTTYHLLGNPGLGLHSHTCEGKIESGGETQLSQLVQLAVRVQEFTRGRLVDSLQVPWHSESEFRRLQIELDQYLLQRPDEFCSTREILQGWLAQGSIDRIHCALVWHYCLIILNRVFLPIRRKRSYPDNGEFSNMINYPAAPKHFLAERKNVCEAAASTISTICNEVMSTGSFFPVSYIIFSFSSKLMASRHP